MQTYQCTKCFQTKTFDAFPKAGNGKIKKYCRVCLKNQRVQAALRRAPETVKTCRTCSATLSVFQFPNKGLGLRSSWCYKCYSSRRKERDRLNGKPPKKQYLENLICSKCKISKSPDLFYDKGSYKNSECKECVLQARKMFWDKEKTKIKHYRLVKKYNITLDDLTKIMDRQSQSCAICKGQATTHKGWCVDHDHKTGKVRGILCSPCNFLLGNAKDSVSILQSAIDYLQSKPTSSEP